MTNSQYIDLVIKICILQYIRTYISIVMNIFEIIISIGNLFERVLFHEFFGFPLLVLMLISFSIFFSFYINFPCFKLLKYRISSFLKEDKSNDSLITLKQALFTSLSSVIGMGSITGVATAIYIGGPGAVFWMVIMVIFSTNVSFAETLLATKYREFNLEKKTVTCAPINYIKNSLKDNGFIKLGLCLSILYGFLYFLGLIGSQIYQIGEVVNSLKQFRPFTNYSKLIVIIFDLLLLYIAYFGITKTSKIFLKVLPYICYLYFLSAILILVFNIKTLPIALLTILKEAFSLKSATGGIIGAISVGIRRGIYSYESGLGAATTPYAATKSDNPLKEAYLGMLNPLVAGLICLVTGIVVVSSKSYLNSVDANGLNIMMSSFNTVSQWFSYILMIIVTMTSFSLCLSVTFNALNVYQYYFGKRTTFIFMILQFLIILTATSGDFNMIVMVCDTLYLSVALPNIICLFLSRRTIKDIYDKNILKL